MSTSTDAEKFNSVKEQLKALTALSLYVWKASHWVNQYTYGRLLNTSSFSTKLFRFKRKFQEQIEERYRGVGGGKI